jgi:DNA-binding CsgD family transcriptional regulator
VPASCDLEKGVAWLERLPSSSNWQLRYCRQFTDIRFSVWLVAEAGASQPRGTTLSIHKRVLDHVGQALRLAGRTPDLRYLREPTVVVDTDGAVLSASTSAGKILDRSGPILLRDGALAADDPEINDKLRKAITLSAEPDREVSVVKSTKEGERDHLIVVTPYPWSLTHLPIRAPVAIVRMLDTAGSGWLPQHVIDMFGFTKREAEVARCLLAGHSLESLCYSLGISRNTGKVHLRALFRKTSTSRQADLISLLSRLSH